MLFCYYGHARMRIQSMNVKKKNLVFHPTPTQYPNNAKKKPYLSTLHQLNTLTTQRKNLVRKNKAFFLKSGGYLSSQRLTVSTFGVKELNFCVRNGNRWILFAIVTAMVIYSAFTRYIYFCKLVLLED